MKKLLILDIDETLVYANEERLEIEPDFNCCNYHVYKRPFLNEFLDFALETFEVSVWTSSGEDYADCIVKNIFSDPEDLKFVWSRERCTPQQDWQTQKITYEKNLKKIKKLGFDLKSVIMVDDTYQKIRKSYGNLVLMKEFLGDSGDKELLNLINFLKHLNSFENVRGVEKRGWYNQSWE